MEKLINALMRPLVFIIELLMIIFCYGLVIGGCVYGFCKVWGLL